MLWRSSKLTDNRIEATDGTIGRVADLLFSDDSWMVRWLAVDTGGWLTGRQVLLPASCLGRPDGEQGRIPVELTREQVKDSPGAETNEPVSRQKEQALFRHYGWDPYWTTALPNLAIAPGAVVPPVPPVTGDEVDADALETSGDPHLQSARHVAGYHIHATDEDIGHVEAFLVDDADWAIRYLIVDTR
ncbi:MAG TPA: PRC-barrel domain-containing protein, partial [Thalassobaculum sp.]